MNSLGKCFLCGLCLSVNLVSGNCLGMNKIIGKQEKNDNVLKITNRQQLLTCTPRRDIESVYVENVNFDKEAINAWCKLMFESKIYNVCSLINCSFEKNVPYIPGTLRHLVVRKCSLTSRQAKKLLYWVEEAGYCCVDLSDNKLGEDEDCFYSEVVTCLQRGCPLELNLSGNGFKRKDFDFLRKGAQIIF